MKQDTLITESRVIEPLVFGPQLSLRAAPETDGKSIEVEVMGGSTLSARVWSEMQWPRLCRDQFGKAGFETLPSALVDSAGRVHVREGVIGDRRTLLRALVEERMHLEFGFPAPSGRSEFTVKLYREAAMAQAGDTPMAPEEILGEVMAYHVHDSRQIVRACNSARVIMPDLDLTAALKHANGLRADLGLRAIEAGELKRILSTPQRAPQQLEQEELSAAASLFKSAETRFYERSLRNRQNMRKFRKMMAEHDKVVDEFADKACDAKRANDTAGFNMLRASLKKALLIKSFMQRSYLSLENTLLNGRQVEAMTVFADTVVSVGQQIVSASKSANFARVCGNWGKAMSKCKSMEDAVEILIEQMESVALEDVEDGKGELDRAADDLLALKERGGESRQQENLRALRAELDALRGGDRAGQS